jgi:hypothetical protein
MMNLLINIMPISLEPTPLIPPHTTLSMASMSKITIHVPTRTTIRTSNASLHNEAQHAQNVFVGFTVIVRTPILVTTFAKVVFHAAPASRLVRVELLETRIRVFEGRGYPF